MPKKLFSVNRTYSLTMIHVNKVIEMALSNGQSQGQIVRDAIDLLYSKRMPISGVGVCNQQLAKKTTLKKSQ
jgi:hypothetical protein